MDIDSDWVSEELKSTEGVFTNFDQEGRLLSFGCRTENRTMEVSLDPLRAVTTELPDPDLSPEEWLEGWQHQVLEAVRPQDFVPNCAFCGKSQSEVRKLIAGPTVMICDECVALCQEIVDS